MACQGQFMVLIYTKGGGLGTVCMHVGGCQRHCEARSITILITKLPEVINFACITQITQTVRVAPHRSFINSITNEGVPLHFPGTG